MKMTHHVEPRCTPYTKEFIHWHGEVLIAFTNPGMGDSLSYFSGWHFSVSNLTCCGVEWRCLGYQEKKRFVISVRKNPVVLLMGFKKRTMDKWVSKECDVVDIKSTIRQCIWMPQRSSINKNMSKCPLWWEFTWTHSVMSENRWWSRPNIALS